MAVERVLRKWGQAGVLVLACLTWVSFRPDVFRGLVTDGASIVGTLYEAVHVVVFGVMVAALAHEVWQTGTE
ncbi:uncharacterized protein HHUB_1055 [Halobacterium hubeiense]|uniref:Uncharacterized protein n=1 Tax=Halobacterium hubeiense TaxID=1407499 RepID=A0A0U5H0J8_9EURY|nr:hypothetical protein [Halobacterium hubeiense]CQH44459.1 uncharacterized protein HHUB_1055 [Halobacterium hubeiense]